MRGYLTVEGRHRITPGSSRAEWLFLPGRELGDLCTNRMGPRLEVSPVRGATGYALNDPCLVCIGQVLGAGLVLLPTFGAPHYDVVLEDATPQEVAKLMSVLSKPEQNPYRRKGR
jgi:hypothetical protein